MEEVVVQKPANDVEDNKIIAAVGYIGILCLVPLLFAKDSAFAKFHGKQGLVLFLCEVVLGLVGSMFGGGMMMGYSWGVGSFFFVNMIIMLINLGLLVLSVAGIIKAFAGERWEMPVIGAWANKFKF